MEIITGVSIALQVVGVATVLLNIVAPLTKNKWDNKLLSWLKLILKKVSLNMDENKIEINIK